MKGQIIQLLYRVPESDQGQCRKGMLAKGFGVHRKKS